MNTPLSLVVLYTVSSGAVDEPLPVTRDQLLSWLSEVGISQQLLPAFGRGVNAFRTATTRATDEYQRGTTAVRLSVTEFASTGDYVKRRVMMTEETSAGGVKPPRWVADLVFYRPRRKNTGRVHGTERFCTLVDHRLKGVDKDRVTALVRDCEKRYELHRQQLSAHALRQVIRNFVAALGGVSSTTPEGGFFLPPEHRGQAEALREVIRKCGSNCVMRILTAPEGDSDLRDWLLTSIDADITGRVRAQQKLIADWTTENPTAVPTAPRWRSWRDECAVLQDLLVGFVDRYDTTFPQAADALADLAETTMAWGRAIAAERRN